ncbi:Serine/threonine-protein phosphatase 2A activator [Thoreauomyces humboldtii]|nr:Serine/threonine-protein phosphatase 2A activator [Thoreauomyces humboldtii]
MPPPGAPILGQSGTLVDIPPFTNRRHALHISTEHEFAVPQKRIHDEQTLQTWLASDAFVRLLEFLQVLNEAARGKTVSDPCVVTEAEQRILDALEDLDKMIDDVPPMESPQRFGNKAFRTWVDLVENAAEGTMRAILPPEFAHAAPELRAYWVGAFGHGTRLDYGSGHELAFVAWLCCLDLLDMFKMEDYQALVTRIFARYLDIVRRLQMVYSLEPAGSHGVWGLDDHQFLPYFWGSSQLINHARIKPKSVLQPDIVAHFRKEFLYLACIAYIHEVKHGPFHEHSPILYDITAVPHWQKVNKGMLKMYIAEVLRKLPVVQHLPFGSLLPFDMPAGGGIELPDASDRKP